MFPSRCGGLSRAIAVTGAIATEGFTRVNSVASLRLQLIHALCSALFVFRPCWTCNRHEIEEALLRRWR